MEDSQALVEFLDEWEEQFDESHKPPEELHLACHQLIEETESLLASWSSATDEQTPSSEEEQRGKNSLQKIDKGAERRFKYRLKVKVERKTLKQQTIDQSNELARLQTQQARREKKQACNPLFSMWKAIAMQQLELRRESEAEHSRLSAHVMNRAALIQQMNAMLSVKPQVEYHVRQRRQPLNGNSLRVK